MPSTSPDHHPYTGTPESPRKIKYLNTTIFKWVTSLKNSQKRFLDHKGVGKILPLKNIFWGAKWLLGGFANIFSNFPKILKKKFWSIFFHLVRKITIWTKRSGRHEFGRLRVVRVSEIGWPDGRRFRSIFIFRPIFAKSNPKPRRLGFPKP